MEILPEPVTSVDHPICLCIEETGKYSSIPVAF